MKNDELQLDETTSTLLTTAFELYNIAKLNNNVHRKDTDSTLAKNLITEYYKLINPNYNNMIYKFKNKYISNEALVEKNDTPEERKGLGLVYDFIQNFDISKDYFNIFSSAMSIHSLLYRPLDEKNNSDKQSDLIARVNQLKEEAKREKNIQKMKQAKELLENSSSENFGGHLRTGNPVMQDFTIELPTSDEVLKIMNSYLSKEKIEEFERQLANPNIIEYIDYAVNTTARLIGIQPFSDGNKRTFRALLNLMFKKKNLPPVYITKNDRAIYHAALEKAICEQDYTSLDKFYHFKICDSIYELDFMPRLSMSNVSIDSPDDLLPDKPRKM